MKTILINISLLLSVMIIGNSCNSEVDCSKFVEGNSLFEDEISDITDALFVFNTVPGFENCQRVVEAYQKWIDALKRWQDCAEQNGQGLEYQEFIREAEQGIADVDCS